MHTPSQPNPAERRYDADFKASEDYRNSLPDMQNEAAHTIEGANVPIQQVGISNFRLPLKFATANGESVLLETSVNGTVSLDAEVKGINMSRIMRTFYQFKDSTFDLDSLKTILQAYKKELNSSSARLKLFVNYPMLKPSLRSGLEGYQYYQIMFEGALDAEDNFRKWLQFDFVYSSACPCSDELSEHARNCRNIHSIPHSQRSKARILAEVAPDATLTPEDLQQHCANSLRTETQVMVRREDEQAFAELNGAYIKFVEDAARLIFEPLNGDQRILDFQVVIAHLESLHSHDAVATIAKGIPGGLTGEHQDFRSLIC